jgi:transposase/IS5 family transposase
MLQENVQEKLCLSPYAHLYELLIPKNNILRQIKEMVDFSFVYDELKSKYCLDNGRTAIDPVMMFKYLLIKCIENISDVDLIERTQYDLSFKYFLDLAPEDTNLINPTSLTKFRRQRLKDVELLDMLINKTVQIAIEKNIIKNEIIVDSTHTQAKYNFISTAEILSNTTKDLRKAVYQFNTNIKEVFPKKPENHKSISKELEYSKKLISIIEKRKSLTRIPKIKEKLNLVKEMVEDNDYHFENSKDKDARVGHKTADSSFFGYKTHLAMTPDRLIVAAHITSGEQHDGKQLPKLLKKCEKAGIVVTDIIGDKAYAEKDNLKLAKRKNIKLIAQMNNTIIHGNRKNKDKFEYNKDAGMYVCKAGHMAIQKGIHKEKNRQHPIRNDREVYYFDVEKCKTCPKRKGCYRDGAKTKTYTVTILSNIHEEHADFECTDYFQEKYKERYKIEAKNGELKRAFGYGKAQFEGYCGMEIQGAMSIFVSNLRRIAKLS